jgi:hypothetical protein
MGDELKLHSVFVGKPEGKRPQKKKAKMGSKWILGRLAEGC